MLDTNCLAILSPKSKWLFWLQKGRETTLKLGQECGAVFPPSLCHQANAPALVWSVESRPPSLSPRLMTSVTPSCSLFLVQLRRATSPLGGSSCIQVNRQPHKHCHPAGACGPPPTAWLRIVCQSAPLPSLCLPAPSPALACLLALSLFMRCKAWRGAEPSAACCRSSSRGLR